MQLKRKILKFSIDYCQGMTMWIFFDSLRVWSIIQTKHLKDDIIQGVRLEAGIKINDSS